MANRSDREHGQPTECLRHHSLISRTGPCSRTPSGPAVTIDCIKRPDRRLQPTNATASIYSLQCGSHPQKTFSRIYEYTPPRFKTTPVKLHSPIEDGGTACIVQPLRTSACRAE